jgi:hypothetical protein
LGYVRYDSAEAQAAIHALYRRELRLFQNLFLPSVKLIRKERVGSRVRRRYDVPRTPLERVLACPEIRPEIAAHLQRQRASLDPFALARAIEPATRTDLRFGEHAPQRAGALGPSAPAGAQAAQHQPEPPLRLPTSVGNIGDGAMIPPSVTFLDGLTGTVALSLRAP